MAFTDGGSMKAALGGGKQNMRNHFNLSEN